MLQVDIEFYESHGFQPIVDDFERLADIASEIIYDVCVQKPTAYDLTTDDYKKAICCQIEMIHSQGGLEAILGFSEMSQAGGSESLGDYSVSGGSGTAADKPMSYFGVPVSPMSIIILRRMGLMCRWAYAGYYRKNLGD